MTSEQAAFANDAARSDHRTGSLKSFPVGGSNEVPCDANRFCKLGSAWREVLVSLNMSVV